MNRFVKRISVMIILLAVFLGAAGAMREPVLAEETEEQLPFIRPEGFEQLDMATRLLEVAVSQLGYTENADNRTKYSDWLNQSGSAWCSEFVAWCVRSLWHGVP